MSAPSSAKPWSSSAGCPRSRSRPPPDAPGSGVTSGERHDVVVVGGGLVGTAAAYYLARRGAGVLLVEQRELNQGASGQNAGSLHFQMERRLIEHGDRLAEQAAAVMPLALDAVDRWAGIAAELGEPDL